MQLSAANLLIASQQLARGQQRAPADAQAQFASALKKEQGVETSSFEPMAFKQTAVAKPEPAPAQAPASGYQAGGRIGANLDIRV